MDQISFAILSALTLILFYFTGFAYLHFYFAYFHIGILEVEASNQFVFVHAFPAFTLFMKDHYIVFFGVLICFAGALVSVMELSRSDNSQSAKIWIALFGLLLIFPLFLICYFIAQHSALIQAKATLRNANNLVFVESSASPAQAADEVAVFSEANRSLALEYLISSKTHDFLLSKTEVLGVFWVFKVPKENKSVVGIHHD